MSQVFALVVPVSPCNGSQSMVEWLPTFFKPSYCVSQKKESDTGLERHAGE